mgnify:CR=1 FL=1
MRANDRRFDTHATDRTYLPVLRRVPQLIIYLTLGDLARTYFGQLPPVVLVESAQAAADWPVLR